MDQDPAAALQSAEEEYAAAKDRLGPHALETLDAELRLAVALWHASNTRRAVEVGKSALAASRTVGGSDSIAAARAEYVIGGMLAESGDLPEAKVVESHCVAVFERETGSTSEETRKARRNLAVTLLRLGEYESVLVLDRETLARERSLQHPDQREILHHLGRISKALRGRGDHRGSIAICYEALDLARALGDVRLTVDIMRNMLEDYAALEDWNAVITLSQKVLDEGLSGLDPDDEIFQILAKNRRKIQRKLRSASGPSSPPEQ